MTIPSLKILGFDSKTISDQLLPELKCSKCGNPKLQQDFIGQIYCFKCNPIHIELSAKDIDEIQKAKFSLNPF